MRKQKSYEVADISSFKDALLDWAKQFEEVVWLDSNNQKGTYGSFDAILAVDALTVKVTDDQNAFEDLKEYQRERNNSRIRRSEKIVETSISENLDYSI